MLADLRQVADNPRGQFVMLQLERASKETVLLADDPHQYFQDPRRYRLQGREAELLKEHSGGWLGPWLSSVGTTKFERGFPVIHVVGRNAAKLAKCTGASALATIEHVGVKEMTEYSERAFAAFVGDPVVQNLRTLSRLRPSQLDLLSPGVCQKIEALSVLVDAEEDVLRLAEALPRFTGWKRLRLTGAFGAPGLFRVERQPTTLDLQALAVPTLQVEQDDDSIELMHLKDSVHPTVQRFEIHRDWGPTLAFSIGNSRPSTLSFSKKYVEFQTLRAWCPKVRENVWLPFQMLG